MKHPKQNGITRMVLMPMLIFGITSVVMSCLRANLTPTLLKQIMRNYVTIWLAWLANHVVSLVAHRHCVVPFGCLLSVTTAGNFTNSVIRSTLPISWTSLAHAISHSAMVSDVPNLTRIEYNSAINKFAKQYIFCV